MGTERPDIRSAAEIVRDAGGRIVGRTKLQKIAYLLQLAGFQAGFDFEYRHYGPYSEDLASAIRLADAFGLVTETERLANWGGHYSIYQATEKLGSQRPGPQACFCEHAVKLGPVELELAATAAFLNAVEGYEDPWEETARRKPEKASGGRLDKAKEAYKRLMALNMPRPLPPIA
jgi:uncharacterized protein YwgA